MDNFNIMDNFMVFIAFQATEGSRPIIKAIEMDNPYVVVNHMPAMVRVDATDRLAIRRETIEILTGRPYDLREITLYLISLSGKITETEDEFILSRSKQVHV